MYRRNGSREILRFDLVQFMYAFVMMPVVFVWMKSFIFFLLRTQLDVNLSIGQIFFVDSVFSTIFLFVYAFVVIHSLTTTFKLKVVADPLYELFELSEYFHLWLSHLVVYLGSAGLVTLLAITNVFVPLQVVENKPMLFTFLLVGFVTGLLSYVGVSLGDPRQGKFMRIMKLSFGLLFLLHVIVYFTLDPRFSIQHGVYWVSLMAFFGFIMISVLAQRSTRLTAILDRFKHKHKWGVNIDLFSKE